MAASLERTASMTEAQWVPLAVRTGDGGLKKFFTTSELPPLTQAFLAVILPRSKFNNC